MQTQSVAPTFFSLDKEKEMAKHYFKRNVRHTLTGRYFVGDAQGWSMNNLQDTIFVEEDAVREFKNANKEAIMAGKIIEVEEPNLDWEVTNAITDAEAKELVKQYLPLKHRLETVTSLTTAQKLLDVAHESDRPAKTIKLIEAKVAELEPEPDTFGFREDDDNKEE